MFSLPESDVPRLLVSVRDVEEALAAVAGGADVVDVKEPSRGALGRADGATIAAVVEAVRREAPGTPTSAALGELTESADEALGGESAPELVKVGLAGMADVPDWAQRLEDWTDGRSGWVGVVYADWRTARAPEPMAVLRAVLRLGAAGVLFDTFDKSGGTLFEGMGDCELAEAIEEIHGRKRFVALAGKVGLSDLPRLLPLGPDVVAVRSAVCRGGDRAARVEQAAVERFRTAMTPAVDLSPSSRLP